MFGHGRRRQPTPAMPQRAIARASRQPRDARQAARCPASRAMPGKPHDARQAALGDRCAAARACMPPEAGTVPAMSSAVPVSGGTLRHAERGARFWRACMPAEAGTVPVSGGTPAMLSAMPASGSMQARAVLARAIVCLPYIMRASKHARLHAVLGCARVRLPYALYVLRAQARLARSVHIAQVRAAYAPHGEYAACFVRKGARKYAPRTRRMAPGGALRAQIAQFSAWALACIGVYVHGYMHAWMRTHMHT